MKKARKYVIAGMVLLIISLTGCCKYKLVLDKDEEAEETEVEFKKTYVLGEEETEEEEIEEETEDETSEKDEEESGRVKVRISDASDDLSDDLYSFQIQIDNEVYQFPMTFEEFTKKGWEYDPGQYEESPQFEPNRYSVTETFRKGKVQVNAVVANLGMNTEPIENCLVCGVRIDEYFFDKEESASVILPGNIERGISTKDDIIAAYGDPSSEYEGEATTTLTYSLDTYQEVKLYVFKEKNALMKIEMENLISPEDTIEDTAEVSDEIPEVVTKYQAPTSLGDELEDFIAEFEGDLYKLPCPVSEFETNGWKIVESSSNMVVKGHSYGRVVLMKNNQQFSTFADNYADDATAINNCFISELKADTRYAKISMELCNGLKIGMKKKDALKILKKEDNFDITVESSYTEYKIPLLKSGYDSVKVMFAGDDDTITSLELNHGHYAEKDFLKNNE